MTTCQCVKPLLCLATVIAIVVMTYRHRRDDYQCVKPFLCLATVIAVQCCQNCSDDDDGGGDDDDDDGGGGGDGGFYSILYNTGGFAPCLHDESL